MKLCPYECPKWLLAKKSRMLFRIYPSDELEGHTAGNFLYEKLGKTQVLLFTGDTEYTRGILPEFLKQFEEALGGEVVGEIDMTSADWQTDAAPSRVLLYPLELEE